LSSADFTKEVILISDLHSGNYILLSYLRPKRIQSW